MRKFIIHTLLFLIPVAGVAIVLLFSPTDKKRAYHYLTNDCEGRGAWLYRRIFESKQPIDLAFLGSSHTINGINDTLINQELAKDQRAMQTVNLGYCRLGRDLTYVLMQHVLAQKNTRNFIIEVLPDENPYSHPNRGIPGIGIHFNGLALRAAIRRNIEEHIMYSIILRQLVDALQPCPGKSQTQLTGPGKTFVSVFIPPALFFI